MKKHSHNASESLPTTIPLGFQSIEARGAETSGWVICAHRVVIRTGPAHTLQHDSERSIQSAIRRRETSPAKRAALERARRRLGASLSQSEGTTLTSIRLSKGLSQAALAAMIGHSQPYIARLEKERQDLRSKTISKLAKALDVSADVIIEVTQPQDANE